MMNRGGMRTNESKEITSQEERNHECQEKKDDRRDFEHTFTMSFQPYPFHRRRRSNHPVVFSALSSNIHPRPRTRKPHPPPLRMRIWPLQRKKKGGARHMLCYDITKTIVTVAGRGEQYGRP